MSFKRIALFERIIRNNQYNDFLNFTLYMWVTRKLSLFNSAVILLQRPEAEYVKNEETWYKRYDRYIKSESTPIVVLNLTVYDAENAFSLVR